MMNQLFGKQPETLVLINFWKELIYSQAQDDKLSRESSDEKNITVFREWWN